MYIDVKLSQQLNVRETSNNRLIVVIDILRATSTIVSALSNGCEEVIPASGVEEALAIASLYNKEDYVLGGERKGEKVDGFECGNSPCEYSEEKISGKKLIMTTTNGTSTIKDFKEHKDVLIASFLNAQATINACKETKKDILLVCSGQNGVFAIEDALFAGLMVDMLVCEEDVILSDSAKAVMYINKQCGRDIFNTLKSTDHGSYLCQIGYEKDVSDCSKISTIDLVAKLSNGRIMKSDRKPNETLSGGIV